MECSNLRLTSRPLSHHNSIDRNISFTYFTSNATACRRNLAGRGRESSLGKLSDRQHPLRRDLLDGTKLTRPITFRYPDSISVLQRPWFPNPLRSLITTCRHQLPRPTSCTHSLSDTTLSLGCLVTRACTFNVGPIPTNRVSERRDSFECRTTRIDYEITHKEIHSYCLYFFSQ